MAKGKYDKYFVSETPPNPRHPESKQKGNSMPWENSLFINNGLDGKLPGAPYLETNMVVRTTKSDSPQRSHSHPHNEYLIFLGTNPDDQFDLGGEVEFWVGGEKHLITKSTAVFVPGGIEHCPLFMRRVDRPFMFITTSSEAGYSHADDAKPKK